MLYLMKGKKKMFNDERFEGKKWAGYGCVVTNTIKDIKDTVTYEELKQNFGLEDFQIYIDKAWVNVKQRPVLNKLLDRFNEKDRIYISDISHLLGTTNIAREYYQKALEKGIELYIIDLTQTLFHIHPLSTLIPKNTSQPIKLDVEKKLAEFDKFAEEYISQQTDRRKNSGRKKCYLNNFTVDFKKVYFAYESYQIDLETAIERAKIFGINNYTTFVNMVSDYEKSRDYYDDTKDYARIDSDFINLPKRVIKRTKDGYNFPSEYLLLREIEKETDEYYLLSETERELEKIDVEQIGDEHNFLINEVIYQRYKNLETMKIPRKVREIKNEKGEKIFLEYSL